MHRQVLPDTTELRNDFATKVAAAKMLHVRGIARMAYKELRRMVMSLCPFGALAIHHISFLGEGILEFVCASAIVASSLAEALSKGRATILEDFDPLPFMAEGSRP
eukprot:TRINITY_DN18856_c0_g1_i1.p1 TRINITY_DN18856_c0_g1~~TRINITY_DN18856_c0_g1_i1.p1  ORF type:complete len:106 (-),score=7.32 TRINITY_DN18856_c0_g1_i1:97-414(-)